MPHAVCVALAFALALQVGAKPLLLGNAASRVTGEDLSAVSQIVGEPIWLMSVFDLRPRTGEQAAWATWAYLMPDRETPQLRQGRIMVLTNRGARPVPSQWSRVLMQGQTTTKWVQVQLPGRLWADVRSTADPNWPIAVSGELSDSDLISLVEFVRSGPVLTAGSRGGRANTRLAPDRRINSVGVDPKAIRQGGAGGSSPLQVLLTTETECHDAFLVERPDGVWRATYTGGACG
jgi:hypothetical protein